MLRPEVLQLQLGDEEQIDERLARRAHELEGRLAKFGSKLLTAQKKEPQKKEPLPLLPVAPL